MWMNQDFTAKKERIVMKCFDNKSGDLIDIPKEMQQFIDGIVELSKQYHLSIAHEDFEGGFLIQPYKEKNINWLKGASKDY